MKNYDAAVIGGGISGLIAAIDLARAKKSVILLEKSSRVGGRAITVNKNGALFNLGGHALYLGGEAYPILQQLGVSLQGGKPSASGVAIWQNGIVPLPGDALKLLSSRLLTLSGKMEFGRFMIKLGKMDTAAMGNISLREWAEQEIRDPMVRHLFYALCRTSTYSKDIDYQRVGPAVRQVQLALKSGVLYLDGGWQTIVDQLRVQAVKAGVTVLNNKKVSQIRHDNGSVCGLLLDDQEVLNVSRIISTLSPNETSRLFTGAEQTALRSWTEDARPIMAACLDLSLRRLPVPGRQLAMGIDQPVFFTNHSRSSKLSGNGEQVVHLIQYNGTGESDPREDERKLEQTMNLLHPHWQKEVVARQYLPNITVVHDYMHIGRRDPMPGPAVAGIEGLYVAGDWASHGEMLADAAAASARRASIQLLKELSAAGESLVPESVFS